MEQTYRKGLTVGDAKGREFKVYDKPKEKYNFVDKIIIQFKKGKMNNNDYGVYKEGTDVWLTVESPVTWGVVDDAINNYSFPEATNVATYLTATGEGECRVGRPKTPPHH